MNKEDFVTYEQAISLRELGFDEECTHYFIQGNQGLQEVQPRHFGMYYISYDFNYDDSNELFEELISAPTLAQVQKWFRKNKQIHVEPNIINENTFRYSIKSVPYSLYRITEDIFNSYEEALLSGITECIKFLK